MGNRQKHLTARHLFGQSRLMESSAQRELMAATLSLSSDPKMRELAVRAMAREYKQHSFAAVMDEMSITWSQVEQEFRSIKRAEGYIRSAQHLPELMEQSAVDAKGKMQPCANCKATGKVGNDICTVCWGRNEIYIPGDIDRQKLVFDVHGLIGKNSGVNVNFDMRQINSNENLEDLADSIGPLLNGEGHIS